MDGQIPSARTPEKTGWKDSTAILVLLLIVLGLRGWQLAHTEVASRDCMHYVRMAWQLENADWAQTLRQGSHHPAYPLLVLAVSWPVRHFVADLPAAMQLSAQLSTILTSLLLVFPLYFYGKAFFGRRPAFWACLLFQCLPACGRVLADGLSEGLFLLLAATSLLCAVHAFRRRSPLLFALCGLTSGLAYLTRPEGAIVAASAGLVLLVCQRRPALRQPWKRCLGSASALTLAALVVAGPYMVVIRGVTVKNSGNQMMGSESEGQPWEKEWQNPERHTGVARHVPLAIWDEQAPFALPNDRTRWAVQAFILVLGRGFFYYAWLPALLGLWWFRDRFREPAAWVGPIACLVIAALLFRNAQRMGYLTDRHLLLVVLHGCLFATPAALRLGEALAVGLARLGPAWGSARAWSCGLLLALALPPLARTLQPLHSERLGFREVGRWLAEHTPPGDLIIDPYCWSYYYAGRVFSEGCKEMPRTKPPCFYVVLEESANPHPHLVGVIWAKYWSQQGHEIRRWHFQRGKRQADIVVYQVPAPRQ
jgi:4-amino-4-deoxy-L-arabinose transferase-like glycosyltransferase